MICPSLLKTSLSAQIPSTFTSHLHLLPTVHIQLCMSVDRHSSSYSSPPTHPPEQSREGLRMPDTSPCSVRDPVAGKWPNACARMGVGLELFKAVRVCLSGLKQQIHPPLLLSFSLFNRTHPMHHCGSVKQACRPVLLGSIHLYNIVIGGEEAPSGPGATVLTVLGVCACVYRPL